MSILSFPRSLVAVLALVTAACAPTTISGAAGSEPPAAAPAAPSPTAAAPSGPPDRPTPADTPSDPEPAAARPDLAAVDLTLQPYVELDAPTAMAVRPGDDALYIAERGGRVVRVFDGEVVDDAVLDISSQTTVDAERGLLGLAFSPDGGELYVSFTNAGGDSQVDAYLMREVRATQSSRRTLLLVAQPYSNHNGGHVVTGPDGLLYLGLGDGGSGGDPLGNGQDRSTLLGGLLRIDPTPSSGREYTVPDDNPFVGRDGRGELFAYGLRNPWRFSFDTVTDDLWIADVGQNLREEVTRLPFAQAAGANLGWNVFEGTRRFSDGRAPDAVPPVFEYSHDGRCSITGGYVYRGDRIAPLRGAYLFGDFCDGVVRGLVVEDGEVTDTRAFDARVPALVSFGEDADGELYVLSLEGTVFRVTGG